MDMQNKKQRKDLTDVNFSQSDKISFPCWGGGGVNRKDPGFVTCAKKFSVASNKSD